MLEIRFLFYSWTSKTWNYIKYKKKLNRKNKYSKNKQSEDSALDEENDEENEDDDQ